MHILEQQFMSHVVLYHQAYYVVQILASGWLKRFHYYDVVL